MLILEKNSFNKKDKIINTGFAVSLSLILLVFLFIPVLLVTLGVTDITPVIHVLLPYTIMIPTILLVMYFVGKPGKLLNKLRLIDLRPIQIPISFTAAIVLLVGMSEFVHLYHKLLSMIGIEVQTPAIEAILKNSGPSSLWWLCFGIIVLAPIGEELIFRRFIFGFLAPRYGFIPALMITSGVFAGIHFSLYSLPALFFLGIGFQLIYLKFGSLYPAIFMHAFNNAIAVSLLLLAPQLQV